MNGDSNGGNDKTQGNYLIKVAAHSFTTAVAGSLAGVIRDHGKAEMQAIGAGAVNQAVKAVAIARSYLVQDGLDIVAVPTFHDVDIHGEERTAIRFFIESRPYNPNTVYAAKSVAPRDPSDAEFDGSHRAPMF